MKLTESQLRQIIKEELSRGTAALEMLSSKIADLNARSVRVTNELREAVEMLPGPEREEFDQAFELLKSAREENNLAAEVIDMLVSRID